MMSGSSVFFFEPEIAVGLGIIDGTLNLSFISFMLPGVPGMLPGIPGMLPGADSLPALGPGGGALPLALSLAAACWEMV
jgi:hypothetical protein